MASLPSNDANKSEPTNFAYDVLMVTKDTACQYKIKRGDGKSTTTVWLLAHQRTKPES